MSIGYACLAQAVPGTDIKKCMIKNASPQRLREMVNGVYEPRWLHCHPYNDMLGNGLPEDERTWAFDFRVMTPTAWWRP